MKDIQTDSSIISVISSTEIYFCGGFQVAKLLATDLDKKLKDSLELYGDG